MGYFSFYIIKKIINSLFSYIRKNKKFIIIFIIFVCMLFIREKCFAVTTQGVDDVYQQLKLKQDSFQNQLVFFLYPPFYNDTDMWRNCFLPIFQEANGQGYSIYIEDIAFPTNNTNLTQFHIRLLKNRSGTSTTNYYGGWDTTIYTYQAEGFTNTIRYSINYYHDTNSATMTRTVDTSNFNVPFGLWRYENSTLVEFENLVARREAGYTEDYSVLLNQLSTYLDDINDVNEQLLSTISSFTSTLNQISSNTSTNYSQQIGQISSKVSDLLDDNDTIISQNADMIEQQEQINDNLEDVNENLQDVKDTITDDTVESTASDLPSTDVTDPTQNGIDNIFSSIYNAFCVGQAQDIVFPIPFTDKNISLSPYYVRDMLNNNGAGWVYTLIQAFWGYLIGRFIIKDILNKITKIKSGNIEEIQNDNIKGEML